MGVDKCHLTEQNTISQEIISALLCLCVHCGQTPKKTLCCFLYFSLLSRPSHTHTKRLQRVKQEMTQGSVGVAFFFFGVCTTCVSAYICVFSIVLGFFSFSLCCR